MTQKFALQICSTGETIFEEETVWSAASWHKKTERRLLRYKRTPQRVREAILTGDTIVGWINGDGVCVQEVHRVFKGYDKFFEMRIDDQHRLSAG